MATTFNRYDGPHLTLPVVLAWIDVLKEENGCPPTIGEIIDFGYEREFRGRGREWVEERVRRIIKLGVKKGYIKRERNGRRVLYDTLI